MLGIATSFVFWLVLRHDDVFSMLDELDRPRYSNSTENFKRPKNRKDSSDLDENLPESIAATQTFI